MFLPVDPDTLSFELERRRERAALSRLARCCHRDPVRGVTRLRWVLGTAFPRLGNLLLGDVALRPGLACER